MATSPLNKSSVYVGSLVSFILDTKPYHSKLTEIVEEYQFAETLNVKITENSFVRSMHKAAWPYSFFSGGNVSNRTMQVQRLIVPDVLRFEKNDDPLNNAGRFKAQRDENLDMLNVPLVFSKKQFDGVGIAEAWLEVGGENRQPYVEGHDYLQSHGSLQLQVRQLFDVNSDFAPLWSDTRTDGVIAEARAITIALANDLGNPNSANRQLRTFVASLQVHLNTYPSAHPGWVDADLACTDLIAELDTGVIPQPYTIVSGDIVLTGYYDRIVVGASDSSTPAPPGFTDWIGEDGAPLPTDLYVDERFGQLLPPLLQNQFSDMSLWQTGLLSYDDKASASLSVTNVDVDVNVPNYEEWTLTCVDVAPPSWQVVGTTNGVIGYFTPGSSFTSALISFDTTVIGAPVVGETVTLTPRNQVIIHPTAQTQAWNIIKVNPRSYSRPVYTSTRYGYIMSLTSEVGNVTILDNTLEAGTVVLTATSATQFLLTHTADPLYTAVVTVGTVFNDGRLGFTIIAGISQPFQVGDRFYIQVTNEPATPENFNLYYGYDLDSYDVSYEPEVNFGPPGGSVVYDNQGGPLDGVPIRFAFDSRFTDYDPALMNLVLTQAAVHQRQFRLVAVADGAAIATLKKDGSGPSEFVDLEDTLGGVTPPVFSMPGDADPQPDIALYLSDTFRLEYSDDGFNTTTVVGLVPVGGSFSDPALGISFDLPAGSKPFIAAISDDGLAQPDVEGGDMVQWTVNNPPPAVSVLPIGLVGAGVPHLIMQGDGFFWTPPATWTLTFSSPTAWSLTGIYTAGPNVGNVVTGYPVVGQLPTAGTQANEGLTYRDDNVHFTVNVGSGLYATDTFTFHTYERKPSFAVHGSVSGWQPDATYGEWYWNGQIGFKIDPPSIELFEKVGVLTFIVPPTGPFYNFGTGAVELVRLRPDVPELNYTFTRTTFGFVVTRSDTAVIGYAPLSGQFEDQYLRVIVTDPGQSFTFKVIPDRFVFWNAQDTLIVRSDIDALEPTADDFVSVRKTEEGSIGVRLDYSAVLSPPDLTPLQPIAQDPNYIDTFTNGIPLYVTSPETAWLTGWLPLYAERYDSATSVAHFPDPVDRFILRSAGTGQVVGEVQPGGLALNEPTLLEFDPTFFSTYLPLNASADIVTYGTGLDENVRVLMSERINFLFSGDALLVNALFQDTANVVIDEEHEWDIISTYENDVNALVQDAFTGFLPGFDNLPYDAEDASGLDLPSLAAAQGQFDTGSPLVDHYLRAFYLASQPSLSPAEQDELNMLVMLVHAYLVGGDVLATTLQDFIDALNADAYITGGTGATLGIPSQGHAFDTTSKPGDGVGTGIQESMFIFIDENDILHDEEPYDVGPMDAYGDDIAYLFSNSLPPVPPLPHVFGSYATFETSLAVEGKEARIFQVSFANPPPAMPTPTFKIWRPSEPAPEDVVVVETISNGLFRFSISVPSEAKIAVT